jgi:hypothetical protein
MPHKFGVNASNLVLMHKKTGGGDHYNFIFSSIMFYIRLGECQENLRGEPLAFSFYKLGRRKLVIFSYFSYNLYVKRSYLAQLTLPTSDSSTHHLLGNGVSLRQGYSPSEVNQLSPRKISFCRPNFLIID